jgi:hypothetical protein
MLLLRDFLASFAEDAVLFAPERVPISVVAFSWSMADDGIWAMDFRVRREAGRVTSSREDMVSRGG